MTHLLADLAAARDPWWSLLALLMSGAGVTLMLHLITQATQATGWSRTARIGGAALVSSGMGCAVFLAAFKSAYPLIPIAIPLAYAAGGSLIILICSLAAVQLAANSHRSGRNVFLAGSLMAFGFSCLVFTGVSGMVAPFALSYDLTAVLAVMILGSVLGSFAIWENGNAARQRPLLIAIPLGVGSIAAMAFGSVAAILSFGDWMNAVAQPDDLTSSPIVVIAAAEGVTVLVLSLLGSLVDNRVAARDKLEADRLHQLADGTFEAILIHRDATILDGNRNLAVLLGLSDEPVAGCRLERFVPEASWPLWAASASSQRTEGEIATADGRSLPVEMLSRPIEYRGRTATVTALRDITERRASEARIRFLAHHDALTELPNRALLGEELAARIRAATVESRSLAVLCLDLDGFKLVNDTFGHAAGDDLLQQVAGRLRACLRTGELVARLGGDEFVVLQAIDDQSEQSSDLAQRIIQSLTEVFDLEGRRAHIGTSIGIAICPANGVTPQQLLTRADIALYRAKHSGRGCLRFFDPAIDHEVDDRPQLEQELRNALVKDELTLLYQPIFDADGRVVCFEALMRWTHPILGEIPPSRFIPIAEKRKFIVPMGEWAIERACTTAASWAAGCRVAVNLSPVQILQPDLARKVETILRRTGLAADRLELEITEGVLLQDAETALTVLGKLNALGVRIVLDDFGTGYSSLSYLHRFRFQKLKIDRLFVGRLSEDQSARSIVKAILSMSQELGIEVTAEGVETTQQASTLRAQGCNEFQGFLLGYPSTAETAKELAAQLSTHDIVEQLRAVSRELHAGDGYAKQAS